MCIHILTNIFICRAYNAAVGRLSRVCTRWYKIYVKGPIYLEYYYCATVHDLLYAHDVHLADTSRTEGEQQKASLIMTKHKK
jgi:hypothetical protein